MICDGLIPADHLLRKLAAAVDLSFVSELVSDCYCPDNGRPSWDPLVLFKVVFLLFDKLRVVSNVEPQFLYDLLSGKMSWWSCRGFAAVHGQTICWWIGGTCRLADMVVLLVLVQAGRIFRCTVFCCLS